MDPSVNLGEDGFIREGGSGLPTTGTVVVQKCFVGSRALGIAGSRIDGQSHLWFILSNLFTYEIIIMIYEFIFL